MKQIRQAIILAVVALLPLVVAGQKTPATPPAEQGGTAAAQPTAVRITSPHSGQRLNQDYVDVTYELTNPAASASSTPNFQLQLDNRDPVDTSSEDYTFTGLAPGPHTVTVQLVDANNTPIPGASSRVQFVVLRPSARLRQGADAVEASLKSETPPTVRKDVDGNELPAAGGALPLVSVIGFGALLGGIASALKTR